MSANEQYVSISPLFPTRRYQQDDKTVSHTQTKGMSLTVRWGGMGHDFIWQAC